MVQVGFEPQPFTVDHGPLSHSSTLSTRSNLQKTYILRRQHMHATNLHRISTQFPAFGIIVIEVGLILPIEEL